MKRHEEVLSTTPSMVSSLLSGRDVLIAQFLSRFLCRYVPTEFLYYLELGWKPLRGYDWVFELAEMKTALIMGLPCTPLVVVAFNEFACLFALERSTKLILVSFAGYTFLCFHGSRRVPVCLQVLPSDSDSTEAPLRDQTPKGARAELKALLRA